MKDDIIKILRSWKIRDSKINSTQSLLDWIHEMNEKFIVNVNEIPMSQEDFWFYNKEKGIIENKKGSFFFNKRNKILSERRCCL